MILCYLNDVTLNTYLRGFFPLDLCIIFSKDINPQTPQAIEFKRICKGDGLNVESWFLSSCPVSMMLFKTWDMEVSNVSEVM